MCNAKEDCYNHVDEAFCLPENFGPTNLIILGDSKPFAGDYKLTNTTHLSYPVYVGDVGNISVQNFSLDGLYWVFQDGNSGVKLTHLDNTSYSPVNWDGWHVEEDANKTVVLSFSDNITFTNYFFCKSSTIVKSDSYEHYFINKSHPHYCNNNKAISLNFFIF